VARHEVKRQIGDLYRRDYLPPLGGMSSECANLNAPAAGGVLDKSHRLMCRLSGCRWRSCDKDFDRRIGVDLRHAASLAL
jgi:hypothetical protein